MRSAILKPYEAADALRFVAEGEEIILGDRATTGLALVIHELATNAAKYGAQSQDGGSISISWRLQEEAVVLRWVESGGPAIAAEPVHQGFGSTLARNTIVHQLGGTSALNWLHDGLAAEFVLPLGTLAH
jgi:two-component sensor histidine kinase